MPISQSRHAPLTSVATSAVESRPDLSSSFDEDSSKRPSISTTAVANSPGYNSSPHRPPYSPGMRSLSSPHRSTADETITAGEIQMQSFADGAPPPPPVSHSWKKIDRWLERNYQELFDQLGEGCTQNDINELEHELDCSLPQDVRDSLTIHDGQERGGTPTGVVFSCMLLDCEEIVQEWKNWQKVNEEYLNSRAKPQPEYPIKGLNTASSSSSHQSQSGSNKLWRQELLDRQDSQPPKAIQKAYCHPHHASRALAKPNRSWTTWPLPRSPKPLRGVQGHLLDKARPQSCQRLRMYQNGTVPGDLPHVGMKRASQRPSGGGHQYPVLSLEPASCPASSMGSGSRGPEERGQRRRPAVGCSRRRRQLAVSGNRRAPRSAAAFRRPGCRPTGELGERRRARAGEWQENRPGAG